MTRSLAKAPKFKNDDLPSDSEDDHGNGEDSMSRSRDKAPEKKPHTLLKKTSSVHHTSGHHGQKFKNNVPSSDGKDEAPASIDHDKNIKSTIDNLFIVSRSLDKAPQKTKSSKPNHTSGHHDKVHKFKNNEPLSDGKDKAPAPIDHVKKLKSPIGDKSNGEDSMPHSTPNITSCSREDGYHQAPPVAIHSAFIGTQTNGNAKAGNYIYYRQGSDNRKIGNYIEQGNSYMGNMYL